MSLRMCRVSHFRRLVEAQMMRLLTNHPEEHERFNQLKAQVRKDAPEAARERKDQVWRAKLLRRQTSAFRGHIAMVRNLRGLVPADCTGSGDLHRLLGGVGSEAR